MASIITQMVAFLFGLAVCGTMANEDSRFSDWFFRPEDTSASTTPKTLPSIEHKEDPGEIDAAWCPDFSSPPAPKSNLETSLTVVADPVSTQDGRTERLTVTCFLHDVSAFAHPVSIALYKQEAFKEKQKMATLTTFYPNCPAVEVRTNATATGNLLQHNMSFLRLEWNPSKQNESAMYICAVSLLSKGRTAEPLEVIQNVTVKYLPPGPALSANVSSAEISQAVQQNGEAIDELITLTKKNMKTVKTLSKRSNTPKSCKEVWERKVVTLSSGMEVLCDNGWTVIQHRSTGDVDFYQDWDTYAAGFGSLEGEFWLGNEKISKLTRHTKHELRVDMEYYGDNYYAIYKFFKVSSSKMKYKLKLGGYIEGTGGTGNSLSSHNDKYFSTKDWDNDGSSENCAQLKRGGWWYHSSCANVNLNGVWGADASNTAFWESIGGTMESVDMSEMKIRQTS